MASSRSSTSVIVEPRSKSKMRLDGIVIARSHRASKDARLSTGYATKQSRDHRASRFIPWIDTPSLALGLAITDQPERHPP
jgi:hypothetical protein